MVAGDPASPWTDGTPELPTEMTARNWLEAHGQLIRDALNAAAEQLECGIDSGMPWETTIPGATGPTRVSASAIRRLTARQIGVKLRGLAAKGWETLFPTATPAR